MINDSPKYQTTSITLMPRPRTEKAERKSTSLKVDPDIYTEFAIVARRRHMEIADLLDEAMQIVIDSEKHKETSATPISVRKSKK